MIMNRETLVQRLEYALQVAKEDGNCHILRVNLAFLSSRIDEDYGQDKKEKMDVIKELEKVFKATGAGNTILEDKLRLLDIETNLAIDYVYFRDTHTNRILYGFEL